MESPVPCCCKLAFVSLLIEVETTIITAISCTVSITSSTLLHRYHLPVQHHCQCIKVEDVESEN